MPFRTLTPEPVPHLLFIPCPLQGAQSHFGSFIFVWIETLDPLMSIDRLPPPSFNHIQCAWSIFLGLCSISPSHSSSVPAFASQDAPENLPKLCQFPFPRAGPYLLTPSSNLTPTSIWIDYFGI